MTASAAEAFEIENPVEEAPEIVTHLAKCAECGGSVRYQLTSSGHGLMVLDRSGFDSEQSFGLSDEGLPTCPNGHGVMPLADEQLPTAEEAFALAQERVAAAAGHTQPSLPGVVLPFNFQGAYLELEEKAVEVDRLHAEYKAAAEEAKDAKKAWDKAAELYTKMALECRRRRRAKAGEPAEDLLDASEQETTNLVRCKWEEQHPGLNCPICSDLPYARRYFGDDLAARDSVGHVEQIEKWQTDREVNGVIDALDAIDIVVTASVIHGWSGEDRVAVEAWATASLEGRDDSTVTIPERPKVLGTGHVAGGDQRAGEAQCCTQCDAVLIAAGDESNYYDVGVIVGVDCPGKAKAEGQHYIKRGRKKKTATAGE